jgi:hypothetical protein
MTSNPKAACPCAAELRLALKRFPLLQSGVQERVDEVKHSSQLWGKWPEILLMSRNLSATATQATAKKREGLV